MENPTLLYEVALALGALAQGRFPDNAQVLAGAVALQLDLLEPADRELLEGAHALLQRAIGGNVDLDEAGCARAADLARKVHVLGLRSE